ncbi:peptidoglycan recognition protein family protein [Streptomyces bobili]|uniref:peptidoglycan recognition protein family protein n=1 Tax=Streptomyces bobili TaxID=67280 RepID=UPI00371E088F
MRPRSAWIAGGVLAAGLSGVLIVQSITSGATDTGTTDGRSGPVETTAHTVALTATDQGSRAVLKQRATERFSMLGITWTDPSVGITGTIEARSRAVGTGEWSRWLRLDGNSGQGEADAARGGTEPAWVGPSDGIEVRVTADGTTSGTLPAGLRLDLIDPGKGSALSGGIEPAAFLADGTTEPTPTEESGDPQTTEPQSGESSPSQDVTTPPEETTDPPTAPATSPAPSSPAPPSPTPSASPSVDAGTPGPPSSVPRPLIVSRADWGADETLSPEAPSYLPGDKIKGVVVHHTAESNSYTCADAPAVVRGIYAYHVRQLGWKDLGYNFLVDKCGAVYEGRKGGVDRPVMGAHAYGFNAETTGISVLGTYTDVVPSNAALTSVARIAAWKLGQYGVSPTSTVSLTASVSGSTYARKSFTQGSQLSVPAISGHRETFNTQCPGNQLFAQLPTVRSWAAGPVSGLTLKSVTGAGLSGTTYYTKSGITVNWSATTPSALISRYELLVDGKLAATTSGSATSAKVTLTAGSHQVQVRATHQSGRTTTSTAATVVAETTAPTFTTKPSLALRTGTVNTTAVPMKLSWKATDNTILKEVRQTTPSAAAYGPTATSANTTGKAGTGTPWSLAAYDLAGNTATASVTGTPVIVQETAATKSGTWSAKSSSSYLGGGSYSATAKNASLSWTFTGRSVAWVVSRATTSGQADIYVDGTKITTVDLKSATTKYRDAIWSKTWASSTKHTVKIVVTATAGRPTVTTDGIVYLK